MDKAAGQRVAVITGASSGIGKETARALLGMGWHVIAQGRDAARCAAAEAELRSAAAPGARLDFRRANLSLMAETQALAEDIAMLAPHIDVLINNAGGVREARHITAEGMEETFAANHFAPFLLTRALMPRLQAAAQASAPGAVRVLAVSSLAYLQPRTLNWDDLQHLHGEFQPAGVYCEAKLANQLFNIALDRRIAPLGMVSQALVPGPVRTNFASHGDATMQAYMANAEALTPEDVARTLVWMATAPETGEPGGRMFYAMAEVPVQPHGRDAKAAERLWAETERVLAAMGYPA